MCMYVQENMYRKKNGCLRNKQRMKEKGVATVVFLIMSGKDGMGWDHQMNLYFYCRERGRGRG